MTLVELEREAVRLSRLLDDALAFLRKMSGDFAEAEAEYRRVKAEALLSAVGTVAERQATADLACGEELVAMRLSEGLRQAGLEAVRSRRQQLSAWQSLVAAYRAEAEFVRTWDGGNE